MPLNNPLLCPLILGTLTSFLADSYGSITDTRLFRLKNVTEIETFRRESLSDAIKPGAIAGVITRKGFFAFDSDNNDAYKTAGMDSQHLLMNAKLKHMGPAVQCAEDAMTLRVKGGKAPHFLVDNGEGTLIPMTWMPSRCGFSVRRSRRDVLFVAPYQGCHVTEQGGDHVLHLKLWGKSMTMSCPLAPPLPSVSCFMNGMVLSMGNIAAAALYVKVSDAWEPLLLSGEPCGFIVESNSRDLIIKAPYRKPCILLKDEDHVLVLLVNDQEFAVSCPSSPAILAGIPATSPANPQMLTTNSAVPAPDPFKPQAPAQSPYPYFPGLPHFPWFPPYSGFPTTDSTRGAPADLQMPTTKTIASADLSDAVDSSDTQSADLHPYSWFPGSPKMLTITNPSDPESVELPSYPQVTGFPLYPGYPRLSPSTRTAPADPQMPTTNTAASATASPSDAWTPEQHPYPHFPGFPPHSGFFYFPGFPPYSQFPTNDTTRTAPADPQMPTTNTAASTTASPSDAWTPEQPPYPHFPGFPPHSGYFYFPGYPPYSQFPTTDTTRDAPVDLQIPTTRTSSASPSDPKSAELPLYPQFPPYPGFSQFPGFPGPFPNTEPMRASPAHTQMPTTKTAAPSTEAPPDPESAELPLYPQFPGFPPYPRPFPAAGFTRAATTDPQIPIAADPTDPESVTLRPYPGSPSYPGFPQFPGFPSYPGIPSYHGVPWFPGFPPYTRFSRPFPTTATTRGAPSTAGSSDPQMPEQSPYHYYPGFPEQSGFPRPFPMTAPTKVASVNPKIPPTKITAPSTAGSSDPELAELPPYPRFTRFPPDTGFPRPFPMTAITRALASTASISDPKMPEQPLYHHRLWFPHFQRFPAHSGFPRPFPVTAPTRTAPNDPQLLTTKTYGPTTPASGWITATPYKPSNSKRGISIAPRLKLYNSALKGSMQSNEVPST
ncbi:proteoglycan 4-like [Osmerus eperlanus]|uniref:proteoglycan 4-like n=1 Tax=Osmerus eperlanus TaxID=29151 RepID=UPI002E1169E4